MNEPKELVHFERAVLPHLDAAYGLARWLVRDDHDAEDVVQEAYLRALRFFTTFHGGDLRAWLLTIVRNTSHTWLRQRERRITADDEDLEQTVDPASPEPGELLARHADRETVRQAIEELPILFREAIVLRELDELSYKEIAGIVGVPIGTVMSRLARGRRLLHDLLIERLPEEQ